MRIPRIITFLPVLLLLAAPGFAKKQEKPKEVKPGMNFFSVDQDIQLGKEASAQIEREVEVLPNKELTAYVEGIGRKLLAHAGQVPFPFTFKVVNDPSINAFALPGGPCYVNTGLIAAADSEAQVAGVLGHEIGHVLLRHGTNQASRANIFQMAAQLGGAMASSKGGILGSLAEAGIGLGANGVLMKFSRTAETQSDLVGARMLQAAGWNPLELARFFEKLEAESGKGGKVQEWFSSHPNPGNRVKTIQDDMRFYPKKNYTNGDDATFQRMKAIVKGIPAPKPKAQGAQISGNGQAPNTQAPNGFRVVRTPGYAVAVPQAWGQQIEQNQVNATLAPKDGVVQGQNGQLDVGFGALIAFSQHRAQNIADNTKALVQDMTQSNPTLKVTGQSQAVRIDNLDALITPLEAGESGIKRGDRERIALITVQHPQALFHMVLVAPSSVWSQAEPQFQAIVQSLRFQ